MMEICICATCKNLKSVIEAGDGDQKNIMDICEFGFPTPNCETCEENSCEATCKHYIKDEEEQLNIVCCATCGKEIKGASTSSTDGDVFCPICYLNKL
ncbi:MAG: hypothetical protein ACRCSG_07345 [Cellulosilyticaceae bacterium]